MKRLVLLDAGPLGLLAFSKVSPLATECNEWLRSLLEGGIEVVVPEITDYEVRRELLRGGLAGGIARLDALTSTLGLSYLPLSTEVMRRAASLWAEARSAGRTTADPKALDCDVILSAQAQLLEEEGRDIVVATTNVRHLSLFVRAANWRTSSFR